MSHCYTFKIILWMKCGVRCKSSKGNNRQDAVQGFQLLPKAHAVFMRTPAARMRSAVTKQVSPGELITLPEADGAAWGAVASHKPHGSLWYHRCKGNPGFLNLQLGSPWLCPHEWVVWSNPCSHLFHCNLASFTGWLCWAQMKFLSEKKLKKEIQVQGRNKCLHIFWDNNNILT